MDEARRARERHARCTDVLRALRRADTAAACLDALANPGVIVLE